MCHQWLANRASIFYMGLGSTWLLLLLNCLIIFFNKLLFLGILKRSTWFAISWLLHIFGQIRYSFRVDQGVIAFLFVLFNTKKGDIIIISIASSLFTRPGVMRSLSVQHDLDFIVFKIVNLHILFDDTGDNWNDLFNRFLIRIINHLNDVIQLTILSRKNEFIGFWVEARDIFDE